MPRRGREARGNADARAASRGSLRCGVTARSLCEWPWRCKRGGGGSARSCVDRRASEARYSERQCKVVDTVTDSCESIHPQHTRVQQQTRAPRRYVLMSMRFAKHGLSLLPAHRFLARVRASWKYDLIELARGLTFSLSHALLPSVGARLYCEA